MPEMIRYLTKKFSSHSLTEVKPAELHFSVQGHSGSISEQEEDKNLLSSGEDELEDEEISTINLTKQHGPGPSHKYSPKESDQGGSSCSRFPPDRLRPTTLRHITPPLRQFEMRLPGIETERKHPVTIIKPRKCQRNPLLDRQSPLVRRAAFQDTKESQHRPSAFIRIPHIEVAKIHPRPESKHKDHKLKTKEFTSPLAEKITISNYKPALPRSTAGQETSHSDSEISEPRSTDNLESSSHSITRTGSFTRGKSPTPSLSLAERGRPQTPVLRVGTMVRHSPSPPLISHTPSPPLVPRTRADSCRVTPPVSREGSRITPPVSREGSRITPPSKDQSYSPRQSPSPRFEYKCFTKLLSSSTESENESQKLSSVLLESVSRKFVPISDKKPEISCDQVNKKLGSIRESQNKLNIERISHGGSVGECWDRTDVEMVEQNEGHKEQDRNSWHRERINTVYTKDLKRKCSVVPVDEEVRSICASNTSSANFKAFILTSNPSQSGHHHRTIDISVVRPNKRVCCTDSPPSHRRPSINVEKMAQTVLLRRPVVRKAGSSRSTRVWSTKEENMVRPVPIRPFKQPTSLVPTSTT